MFTKSMLEKLLELYEARSKNTKKSTKLVDVGTDPMPVHRSEAQKLAYKRNFQRRWRKKKETVSSESLRSSEKIVRSAEQPLRASESSEIRSSENSVRSAEDFVRSANIYDDIF